MIEKASYPQPISVNSGIEIVDFFLNNPISAHPFKRKSFQYWIYKANTRKW